MLSQLEVEFKAETVKPQPEVALASFAFADFKKMLENEALSDFQLETSDGVVLKAHKVILAARSPVFFTMLTTDMEEKLKGSANVPDFNSIVMKEILSFIYCNEVNNLDDIVFDLIYAAEKYQIKELKKLCLQHIASMLHVENVVNALIIVNLVSEADELFDECSDLVVK